MDGQVSTGIRFNQQPGRVARHNEGDYMYKYRNEKNKAIGTDGWDADHEESSSCIYTGLWNDSVLVGLIVEHMGDDDSHDEMCARFHAKAQDVVNKCNAYNELLTIQAQLVSALRGCIYLGMPPKRRDKINAALAAAGAQP